MSSGRVRLCGGWLYSKPCVEKLLTKMDYKNSAIKWNQWKCGNLMKDFLHFCWDADIKVIIMGLIQIKGYTNDMFYLFDLLIHKWWCTQQITWQQYLPWEPGRVRPPDLSWPSHWSNQGDPTQHIVGQKLRRRQRIERSLFFIKKKSSSRWNSGTLSMKPASFFFNVRMEEAKRKARIRLNKNKAHRVIKIAHWVWHLCLNFPKAPF